MKKLEFTFTVALGRSRTITKNLCDFEDLPQEIKVPFTETMAEAQLLEFEIKKYIANDVVAFANENSIDLIDTLNRSTLGQSLKIVTNASQRKKDQIISQCVSFIQMIEYGFTSLGTNLDFRKFFEKLVNNRNKLAHEFLANVILTSESQSLKETSDFLSQMRQQFQTARIALAQADFLSSKIGGINPDGTTAERIPKELGNSQ